MDLVDFATYMGGGMVEGYGRGGDVRDNPNRGKTY